MTASHELLGAAVAACSALLYDTGYVLEKQALTTLPPMRLHPADLLRTARESKRWLAGFVAMLAGLGLQVIALTLAPVSVVQPILAGGLIALAATGSHVLGERLTRHQKAALALVLVAVAAIAVSAGGSERVSQTVPWWRFLALAAVIAGMAAMAVAAVARTRAGPRAGVGPGSGAAAGAGRAVAGLAATAIGAGLLYGLGAVAEKAVATRLVGHGLVAGAVSSLATVYPWLFLAVTVGGMLLFQVGLQAHPASLMASLTNVVSTACALAGAAVVFGETLLPGGWWSAPRLAGFCAVLGAVGVLTVATPVPSELGRPDPAMAP